MFKQPFSNDMDLILKTERLAFIPFTIEDEGLFLELNNDPYVRSYLWDDEIIGEEKAKEIIDQNEILFKQDEFGLRIVRLKENEEIKGFGGLWFFLMSHGRN